MLFQNPSKDSNKVEPPRPRLPPNSKDVKVLDHILPCQKLEKATNMGKRGEIGSDFKTTGFFNDAVLDDTKKNIRIWSASRSKVFGPSNVPSFVAVNSLFADPFDAITRFAFTPVIPHPATEYDTIFTAMRNFQDVLMQKNQEYGPLWCDEGVYRIAKELQLLNPSLFDNISLGLGGFHMEKILIACCGVYLNETGIDRVFAENEIFGNGVANTVVSGSHYNRGKKGMMLLAEALYQLQIEAFTNSSLFQNQEAVREKLSLFKEIIACRDEHKTWSFFGEELNEFLERFELFVKNGCSKSDQFKFWNIFLEDIVSVLINLNRLHREEDWELHVACVRKAVPLFFAFNRSNYRRWAPIYLEDCLALPRKFPKIYESFRNGGFVVTQTSRKGSKLPMDQALEQLYNKPAKSSSGVIGFSRRKEAVCKWNILKHEKAEYTSLLEKICGLVEENEYNIHHEFCESQTKEDTSDVNDLMKHIVERCNPLTDTQEVPINFSNGKKLEKELVASLMESVKIGEKEYDKFKEERLEEKSANILDRISNVKMTEKQTNKRLKMPNIKKETTMFLRVVEIALIRGFDLHALLRKEITTTSFFLLKDGYLRNPQKSEFARELKECCKKDEVKSIPVNTKLPSIIIFDFMA